MSENMPAPETSGVARTPVFVDHLAIGANKIFLIRGSYIKLGARYTFVAFEADEDKVQTTIDALLTQEGARIDAIMEYKGTTLHKFRTRDVENAQCTTPSDESLIEPFTSP